MTRRQDLATATVGAGGVAGGGLVRRAVVEDYMRVTGHKPKVHAKAIMMRGGKGHKKLYLAGAGLQALSAAPLAIGTTRFVRGDRASVAKMGERFAARYTTRLLEAGTPKINTYHPSRSPKQFKSAQRKGRLKPIANRLATDATPLVQPLEHLAKREKPSFFQEGLKGSVDALHERKDTLAQRDVPLKARGAGWATTTAAAAGGAFGTRALLRGKKGTLTAAAAPIDGVLSGAAATPLSSKVVDRVSPGYQVTAAGVKRKKTPPKRPSSLAYTHREIPRSFQSDVRKDLTRGQYRAGVMAAGSVPVAGYGLQAAAARRGIQSRKDQNKAAFTQGAAAAGGDVAGLIGGAHAANYLAERNDKFREKATHANKWVEDKKNSVRGRVGLKPKATKVAEDLKPAGAGTRAGKVVRAAFRPLKGKHAAAAAVGGMAGMFTVGNTASQANINRNYRKYVAKSATAPGMTRAEEQKQLKRKTRLIATNVMGATTGAAGLGTFAASRMHRFTAHKPQLEAATLGLGAIGGGIGSYGGFKRAKVEYKDVKAQRKAMNSKIAKAHGVPKHLLRNNALTGKHQRVEIMREPKIPLSGKQGYLVPRRSANKQIDHITVTDRQKRQFQAMHRLSTKQADDIQLARGGGVMRAGNRRKGFTGVTGDAKASYGRFEVGKSMPDQSSLHVPSGAGRAKSYRPSTLRRTPVTGRLVRVAAGVR